MGEGLKRAFAATRATRRPRRKRPVIFVFGSNEAGHHGAGAARTAVTLHRAQMGKGVGRQGSSYAIPTKDKNIFALPLEKIQLYVQEFIAYATKNPNVNFQVTQIGCGLAGFTADQIAPMFSAAPKNCFFDLAWKHYLGEDRNYWGTF